MVIIFEDEYLFALVTIRAMVDRMNCKLSAVELSQHVGDMPNPCVVQENTVSMFFSVMNSNS